MSQKKLLLIAGFTLSLAQFASAKELAYTQNNPPQQHCATGALYKENPILINADLLYGRVISQQQIVATKFITTSTTSDTKTYNYNNKNKVGFRVGLGVGLGDNDANLSLQYTRQTSGGENKISDSRGNTSPSWSITPGYQFNGMTRSITPAVGDFNLTNNKRLRLQILDLIVQTAKWMPTEVIRFQPFGGARYLNLRGHYTGKFAQAPTIATWRNAVKTQGYGAFIGTDIRFVVYNSFHFFTNLLTGVLAGQVRSNYKDENMTSQPINFTANNRIELTVNPFWEVRFGIMWSYLFNNDVLLAIRLAYEMLSTTHETVSNPIFLNSVIKTQLGSFGVTVAF